MKRVVNFQEQDPSNEEWEFKDTKTEKKKRKNDPKEKFNAKTKRLDHDEFIKKKEEMLAFRKQLPIYSGKKNFFFFPKPTLYTELFVNIGRDAIIQTLENNDTVIVMGETGSGKTTRKVDNFI